MEYAKITKSDVEIITCDVATLENIAAIALRNYETAKEALEEIKNKLSKKEQISEEEKNTLDRLEINLKSIKNISDNAAKAATLEKERYEKYIGEGFLPLISSEQPSVNDEQEKTVSLFTVEDGKILQQWVIKKNEAYIQKQIDIVKDILSSTDYKIIKCFEAQMLNVSLPYDIKTLYVERQSLRDEINRLTSLLEK
jgi:hypothetical protein